VIITNLLVLHLLAFLYNSSMYHHCQCHHLQEMTFKLTFITPQIPVKSIHTFFNFASTAVDEKRLLSYKMLQSAHRPHYCGVQTLPLKMHGGEKLGENWRSGRILIPNELNLTFLVPDFSAKFHQNQVRIATVGEWTDRQTQNATF